jgi:hypothetical protein|tara:strand:- start:1141 stop:1443 length:303 start_codon:yes stop_codon:yes gene_type:complete
MTQQQIIEQIQQVHPEIGETQLRLMLNNALFEFVDATRLNEEMDYVSPIADQRYYEFSSFNAVSDSEDVIEVLQITYGNTTDGEKIIDRYVGEIEPLDIS